MTQNKRTQIIKAAIEVFARKGLERGKIADVAKEAGIGKGTVYEYFRSKEEIFSAIEDSVMGEMMLQIDELLGLSISPAEKLTKLMNEGFDTVLEMGDAVLILTELWAHGARGHWHDEGQATLARMYEDFRGKIKMILQAGEERGEFRKMNKDGVATLLLAFMDGLAWQYMVLKDHAMFQKAKKEAVESFMRGIQYKEI
ncbi:MAG: TetR/AcrR family transcriptional regulator [Candidatus Marinimicrobia bacterium]|nr:TetR/AcrR family transcriptional regulator [Candidatus Neomarinimicrobiota bacterium]